MPLFPKLELRQSQSLVMTPQLMQAIKLLQLSNLDLVAYVEEELERNPLLERVDTAEGPGEHANSNDVPGIAGEKNGVSSSDWLDGTGVESEPPAAKLETDLSNVFQDDHGPPADEVIPALPAEGWAVAPARQTISSEDYNLEAFVADEESLAEYLIGQLGLANPDPSTRLVGRALIDEIDETGYMRADIDDIADRLMAPRQLVESALKLIQSFEPSGIGARNLAECLAIQLAERNRLDPAMQTLLANLDVVARKDYLALRRLCGVDDEDLAEMLEEIRSLNPKPGNAFGQVTVHPVIPDVLVRAGPDGDWIVELNSGTLPRVLVNQSYYATVARRQPTEKDKTYLAECLQTANWLVKSLDQRARTILKVATEIVRQQDGFFAHGVQHLRPLNLKTVAEAIGMHESTVSRVTSNKYMATSRGIFELKYFFTAAIASSGGGDAFSAEAVRHRIRRMIDEESVDDVLSDDAIVKVLRDSGIDIARRTVAKYREAMHIPSSVQRRRDKQAARHTTFRGA
jgi:RNA polymerase sigma-54 factor